MGYCVQYIVYFQGYWVFRKLNYGDTCQFVSETCPFTSRDMGYLEPIYSSLFNKFDPKKTWPPVDMADIHFMHMLESLQVLSSETIDYI